MLNMRWEDNYWKPQLYGQCPCCGEVRKYDWFKYKPGPTPWTGGLDRLVADCACGATISVPIADRFPVPTLRWWQRKPNRLVVVATIVGEVDAEPPPAEPST